MCFISAADSVLEFEAYCAAVAHCRNAPDQSVSMIVKMSNVLQRHKAETVFFNFCLTLLSCTIFTSF